MSDQVWQSEALAAQFLEGVRGAIPLAHEQMGVLLSIIERTLPTVGAFIDLGCGDGILGRTILDEYPEARGTFIDFSPLMLETARTRVGNPEHHTFLDGDFGVPQWRDRLPLNQVDLIVSGFAIHHQPDERKREIYAEIFGLLRPGGLFLNLEHVASASTQGTRLFDEYFIDSLVRFHGRAGSSKSREEIAGEYYHRPDKVANILAPVETQCGWLREIGFTGVDCFFKVFELALFGGWR